MMTTIVVESRHMNINIIATVTLILVVVFILVTNYNHNAPPPPPPLPPKPKLPPPPPPSAPVNVATFIDPVVNLDPTSGTDAKLTVIAGRTTGYVPSTSLSDVGDGSVVSVVGPTSLAVTKAMTLEQLASMVKSIHERAHPGLTLEYETGAIVDGDSVDLRFRYLLHGQLTSVDARRYHFTKEGSQVKYQGEDGKNSGLYVLPLKIMEQFSARELWPVVRAHYINLFGTNGIYQDSKTTGPYSAQYQFMDTINGLQQRDYVFVRNSSGAIEVASQGENTVVNE